MSKYTQVQKVVNFLRAKPLNRFTAKEIANAIVEQYPEDFIEKRKNSRFTDDRAFLNQIVGEIGAQKDATLKADAHIFWQDKPRPRVYWYDPDALIGSLLKTMSSRKRWLTETLYYLKH